MDLAWRLVPSSQTHAVQGYYLPPINSAELLHLCRGLPNWPVIHPLASGFLLLTEANSPIPGSIPLRRLAGDFYLPTRAEVLPSLTTDETVTLIRKQGFVALAGPVLLAFNPSEKVQESQLISLGNVQQSPWQSFPERPARADRLHSLRAELPPEAASEILESGKPDPVAASPEQPGSSPSMLQQLGASGQMTLGKVINWFGRQLGLRSLAEAGVRMAATALQKVPQLSSKVLDAQEAALRDILRQLEAGNIEEALKRAPIAVADPNAATGSADQSSLLSERNAAYSLRNLLASGTGGVAWLGGGDVWGLLANQYRKLAEEAVRRGDFRRAAYLYGVLLRDPRKAAQVLDAGGLHRDAAILFRDKVKDLRAAAGCFEKAGCWDEALKLYQQLEDYEKTAALFRQIGDEDSALKFYRLAAQKLASKQNYLAAGDLIRDQVFELNEAADYWEKSWRGRVTDSLYAGQRLLKLAVDEQNWDEFTGLVLEGEGLFAAPKCQDAGHFAGLVNEYLRHVPSALREDLQDRLRLFLASHLIEQSNSQRPIGPVISQTFGSHPGWSASLVRDAREAYRRATGKAPPPSLEPLTDRFIVINGTPTAAMVSRTGSDILVGATNGEIVRLRQKPAGIMTIQHAPDAEVLALAFQENTQDVVAMIRSDKTTLRSYHVTPSGRVLRGQTADMAGGGEYLQPEIELDFDGSNVRVYGPLGDYVLRGISLVQWRVSATLTRGSVQLSATANPGHWLWSGGQITLLISSREGNSVLLGHTAIPWQPQRPVGSTFTVPPVSWITPKSQTIELVGVSEGNALYWTEVRLEGDRLVSHSATATNPTGFCVACAVGPGLIAAVTGGNQVHWLRADGTSQLKRWAPPRPISTLGVPVFMAHQVGENSVVVLFNDGWATRASLP